MRMSCNGCRVLRKGCNETCTLRPCLQWITNPESQGNATLFLAKFYGRAGLLNLIMAGPQHLRPSIFRSLLYEACGRIINPIYGSVGLQWSNQWEFCEAAVNAVLNGYPVMKLPPDVDAPYPIIPLQSCDIRHLSKDPNGYGYGNGNGNGNDKASVVEPEHEMMIPSYEYGLGSESSAFSFTQLSENHQGTDELLILNPVPIRDYFCAETVQTSLGIGVGSDRGVKGKSSSNASGEIGLELTLGWGPEVVRRHLPSAEDPSEDDDV